MSPPRIARRQSSLESAQQLLLGRGSPSRATAAQRRGERLHEATRLQQFNDYIEQHDDCRVESHVCNFGYWAHRGFLRAEDVMQNESQRTARAVGEK